MELANFPQFVCFPIIEIVTDQQNVFVGIEIGVFCELSDNLLNKFFEED